MSEFKYACPVCGQHIKCDSSQAGSVMECPTCFQKITVPQAPASDDQKFILTGSKVVDKKILGRTDTGSVAIPEKKFPVMTVAALLAVVCIAGAAVFVFRGKIFNSAGPVPPAKKEPPAKVARIAPPASDTNWTLNLDAAGISVSPVAGRIHGQDFIIERSYFQNGMLTLRAGTRGALEFGAVINFGGAQAETLSGQTINVTTNADTAARITLRWKSGADSGRDNFDSGYAMRLEFGPLANNRLPGKIYLCTPDAEKSYLTGTFNAEARKPKPAQPKP